VIKPEKVTKLQKCRQAVTGLICIAVFLAVQVDVVWWSYASWYAWYYIHEGHFDHEKAEQWRKSYKNTNYFLGASVMSALLLSVGFLICIVLMLRTFIKT
jgi:hypothetical protein